MPHDANEFSLLSFRQFLRTQLSVCIGQLGPRIHLVQYFALSATPFFLTFLRPKQPCVTMHTFCYTLVIVVMLESEVERSFGALIEVTFRSLVRTVAVSLEVVRSILELQQLLVRNRTVALHLLPVGELSKFSVDAQIRRVYSAVFLVEKRFDVVHDGAVHSLGEKCSTNRLPRRRNGGICSLSSLRARKVRSTDIVLAGNCSCCDLPCGTWCIRASGI